MTDVTISGFYDDGAAPLIDSLFPSQPMGRELRFLPYGDVWYGVEIVGRTVVNYQPASASGVQGVTLTMAPGHTIIYRGGIAGRVARWWLAHVWRPIGAAWYRLTGRGYSMRGEL